MTEQVWNWIKDDPMLLAAVGTVALALWGGAKLFLGALVGAAVRVLNQVAPAHKGDEKELIEKVRRHSDGSTIRRKVESLMLSRVPESVIREANKRRDSMPPAGNDEAPPD